MTIGSTMPIVTMIDAGATIAAAVQPRAPVCASGATAAVISLTAASMTRQPYQETNFGRASSCGDALARGHALRASASPRSLASPSGPGFARRAHSALERLVPPLLQRGIVLREITVVEIDQSLALVGAEADPLLRFRRDLRIGHRPVVAHV